MSHLIYKLGYSALFSLYIVLLSAMYAIGHG